MREWILSIPMEPMTLNAACHLNLSRLGVFYFLNLCAKNYSSIDDYIKNMDETSKVSKSLKWGGRLVFAWDIYGSVNSVAQVYEKGVPDGTRKEILKQTDKINGGLLGARIGGSIGTAIGGVVIGVVGGTVGLPVLAVVGVIAVGGTLIGGYVGGVTGQAVVEYGYERLK